MVSFCKTVRLGGKSASPRRSGARFIENMLCKPFTFRISSKVCFKDRSCQALVSEGFFYFQINQFVSVSDHPTHSSLLKSPNQMDRCQIPPFSSMFTNPIRWHPLRLSSLASWLLKFHHLRTFVMSTNLEIVTRMFQNVPKFATRIGNLTS